VHRPHRGAIRAQVHPLHRHVAVFADYSEHLIGQHADDADDAVGGARDVAAQVEFRKQTLKPVVHFIGSKG
jgi:hypothetical protein